ncbi:hypothetical protein [Peribacillus sp. Bi96]|uniref:hypothetical protein n=1 Tax=Peribacillus sp. Bi96 TaxID=2884273 RepID=UPI001E4DF05B|nr:hypothetical protein [Peribacillus sp. Bi96]
MGFDSATRFAKEPVNPVKTIPRAVDIIMFTGGILFIAVSYSTHNVWPSYETFSNPDAAANEIIASFGGKTFVTFFLVVLWVYGLWFSV